MFAKRLGGKRVAAHSVTKTARTPNDITAHNHYSGSPAGLETESRLLEVRGEGRPPKRARTAPAPQESPAGDGLPSSAVAIFVLHWLLSTNSIPIFCV